MPYRDPQKPQLAAPEVAIAAFDAPHEAHLAVLHLGTLGIPARIQNDLVVGMAPHLGNAMGGVQVLVSLNDAEEAHNALETLRHELQLERAARRHDTAETGTPSSRRSGLGVAAVLLVIVGLWIALQLR